MFKFVTSDAATISQKRKQQARACEVCRRKKRRCDHNQALDSSQSEFHLNHGDQQTDSENHETPMSLNPHDCPEQTEESDWQLHQGQLAQHPGQEVRSADSPAASTKVGSVSGLPAVSASAQSATRHEDARNGTLGSRFIGDLSPEGILLAATSPDNTRGSSSNDDVGIWLANRLSSRARDSESFTTPPSSQMSVFAVSSAWVQKLLVPALEEEILSMLPPQDSIQALSKIYFDKCHPISPVIDKVRFQGLSPTDPSRVLLQQGICLAASRNFVEREHLILRDSESPLGYREFGDKLFGSMKLSVEMGLVTDKIALIQALSLMSMFANGPESGEMSSQLSARAVHHGQTIGLHVKHQPESGGYQYGTTLFCCIWSLDRMSAAFGGRPVLMHERDFGVNSLDCFEQQEPCFRLFLQIVMLLDKVIELYRPMSSLSHSAPELEFPSFEEMVAAARASQIVAQLLVTDFSIATVETLYHAVAMLSCRSKSWENLKLSSSSYLRQSLASLQVSSILSREFRDQIVLFPFVPYAVSLSLSIAYREMRHSKVSMHRARARAQIQLTCGILNNLGEIFWSASTMAEMGKLTLKEVDRVVAVVASSERQKSLQVAQNRENHITNDGYNAESADQSNNSLYPPTYNFDPSIFDAISDVDLFGMFDPTIDLNGIDACLQGNLDLSFPTHFL